VKKKRCFVSKSEKRYRRLRKAQIDVVSDLLSQAHDLLGSKGGHPAAPAMVVSAALEEFLRTWVKCEGHKTGRKPGIEAYAETLREQEFITKQDAKDIACWTRLRDHAAHGQWDELSDKARVNLMLERVNLFMRKYTPSAEVLFGSLRPGATWCDLRLLPGH